VLQANGGGVGITCSNPGGGTTAGVRAGGGCGARPFDGGFAGWRVPCLASRRCMARALFEMTSPIFCSAYSQGVGAVWEWP
jgi:hypothetical protein